MMTTTTVRRLREGLGISQKDAAAKIGRAPASLNVYETGRETPTAKTLARIARGLALGKRANGETDPAFAVSFDLVGRRLLADREGRVLLFADARTANQIADLLEEYSLPSVALVPCWRNWGGLPKKRRELRDEDMTDIAAAAAEGIVAIAESALGWLPKTPTSTRAKR